MLSITVACVTILAAIFPSRAVAVALVALAVRLVRYRVSGARVVSWLTG